MILKKETNLLLLHLQFIKQILKATIKMQTLITLHSIKK